MAYDKVVDSSVLDGYFSDIADAIREKGASGTFTPAQMPQAIENLPSGGGDANFKMRIENDSRNRGPGFPAGFWPAGLTVIGDQAFCGYPSWEGCGGVTIPAGVTEIGESAFSNSKIESVVFPEGLTTIEANAFSYSRVATVAFPSTLSSFTGVPNDAFKSCAMLTTIDLSMTKIKTIVGTFGSCTNLETVILPGVLTKLDRGAFSYCSNLANITIPAGVTYIGKDSFRNCMALTSLIVPGNYIGQNCFNNCTGLTDLTFTGDWATGSDKKIEGGAFQSCSNCLLYDFTAAEAVPALVSTSAFTGMHANAKIVVPDSLYSAWIAATNWSSSSIVSHIVRESDYQAA